MAKLKTHKSTTKRFKTTKSGNLKHKVPGWGHLKAKKTAQIKYRKNKERVLAAPAKKVLAKLVPGISSK